MTTTLYIEKKILKYFKERIGYKYKIQEGSTVTPQGFNDALDGKPGIVLAINDQVAQVKILPEHQNQKEQTVNIELDNLNIY